MERVVVNIDPAVDMTAQQFAAAWNEDPELRELAAASVEASAPQAFPFGLIEFIALPMAVNLAASALYSLIQRAVTQARRPRTVEDFSFESFTSSAGDRIVVVRIHRETG